MQQKKERLNILFLCSWYPHETKPTLGNFVKKHAEAASRYNDVICVSIFASEKDKQVRLVHSGNESFSDIVAYYPKKSGKYNPISKIQNYLAHRKAFKLAYKHVESVFVKPDLVHLNITYPIGIWALYLKRKKGIPFVVTENSTGLHVGTEHTYPKPILYLCKRILRKANVLLPVSEDLKRYMKMLSPNSKFEIISNVVDENIFQYQKTTDTESIKTFVHISTAFDPHKNITGMLKVLSRISKYRSDFHLKIISDGNVSFAKKLVEELELSKLVSFQGTMTTEEIAQVIHENSALLLFSNYENFPCVIAESMMLGKPIISTDVNGIPEHVIESNGVLVPRGDEDKLEQAICAYLDNKIEFDSNEIHNYAFKHFSYQEVGKSFDRVYRQVLNA